MKKINFKGISETLSKREMKNVLGGSGASRCSNLSGGGGCSGKCDRGKSCTSENGMGCRCQ